MSKYAGPTTSQIDHVLERWDQSNRDIKRKTMVRFVTLVVEAEEEIKSLKAQRDALLVACKAVASFDDCDEAGDWKDAFARLVSTCADAVAAAKETR